MGRKSWLAYTHLGYILYLAVFSEQWAPAEGEPTTIHSNVDTVRQGTRGLPVNLFAITATSRSCLLSIYFNVTCRPTRRTDGRSMAIGLYFRQGQGATRR